MYDCISLSHDCAEVLRLFSLHCCFSSLRFAEIVLCAHLFRSQLNISVRSPSGLLYPAFYISFKCVFLQRLLVSCFRLKTKTEFAIYDKDLFCPGFRWEQPFGVRGWGWWAVCGRGGEWQWSGREASTQPAKALLTAAAGCCRSQTGKLVPLLVNVETLIYSWWNCRNGI